MGFVGFSRRPSKAAAVKCRENMPSRVPDLGRPPKCGLLLVGHGTGEQVGIGEFLATARLVAEMKPDVAVEPVFLEFAEPSIAQGFEALARRAVERVVVGPVLLFSAGHAQRDIPAAVANIAVKHPYLSVEQVEHLGCHEALLALSKLRYDDALAGVPPLPPDETALVMVGRGSHDAQATAEMLRFVELREQLTPVAQARACFVAMADPPLESVLEETLRSGSKRIVVQPHLLFGGVLLDRIRGIVERYAQHHPDRQWVMTQHLGVSGHVASAILDRASAALHGAPRAP